MAIELPVVQEVRLEHFDLYSRKQNVTLRTDDPVVCLIGANGLGKSTFLNVLAYLVVPFSTVLLLDYYLRMRKLGDAATAELFDPRRTVEWGFVAWVIGCAFSSLFWTSTLFTGPLAGTFSAFGDVSFIAGFLGATIAYIALKPLPPLSSLLRGGKRAEVTA